MNGLVNPTVEDRLAFFIGNEVLRKLQWCAQPDLKIVSLERMYSHRGLDYVGKYRDPLDSDHPYIVCLFFVRDRQTRLLVKGWLSVVQRNVRDSVFFNFDITWTLGVPKVEFIAQI